MKRSHLTLGPRHKGWLYGLTALLWLSGTAWLLLPEAHPAQPLWLRIHGAAAMGFLMAFGALLFQHIPRGWRENRQRPSGAPLVLLCSILILTGWALYYVGNESLRQWMSWTHWVLGLLFPVLLILHIQLGRRTPH